MTSSRLSLFVLVLAMVLAACGGDSAGDREMPDWLEEVFPAPGATVAVVDAVEVSHTIQGPDENVRLVIDGVDVTTYATFDAATLRYESGTGPVVLGSSRHVAEVQRVRLPAEGDTFEVVDSFSWEFRSA